MGAGLAGAFAVAIAVHNLEEALGLPAWSRHAGRWHRPVGAVEFGFAVAVLTAAAWIVALLAVGAGPGSLGAYLLAGYSLAMLLNVAVPHVLATLVLGRLMPGTVSAVLVNLPVMVLLLRAMIGAGWVEPATFAWAGPLVVVALLASIPLLFAAGRMLQARLRASA